MNMNLEAKLAKATRNKKEESAYKTIYLKKSMIEKVEKLADEYGLSFSNIIASMVESSLEELENSRNSEEENKEE